MKKDSWIVNQDAVRPRGKPGECFYCKEKLGAEHKKGCSLRQRTVVIEARVKMVRVVQEDWDEQQVNFVLNESSWCAMNIAGELSALVDRVGCLCKVFEGSYVREATPEDEEANKIFVAQLDAEEWPDEVV